VKPWDVIIAGAGLIGLSLAMELRARGATVLALDRGIPGNEASSAAAGMLAPSDPETPIALRALAVQSAQMFPEFVRQIESFSEMQSDFRRAGTLALLQHGTPPPEYRELSREGLNRLEPALLSQGHSAFYVQEDSVDPYLLTQAALAAATKLGTEIRSRSEVKEIHPQGAHIEVLTHTDRFSATSVIDCRGAWSRFPVEPRKGQMLYVHPGSGLLQHVVRAPEVYVVPRSSGKILIGATVENVGYDKSVVPSAIQALLLAAARYLPPLASAPIVHTWAGLRPGTPDGLPLIGQTESSGVYVASGHFRNGILLAPITAKVIANLIDRKPLGVDIEAFSPSRFSIPAD
jgi:glycine oxidase